MPQIRTDVLRRRARALSLTAEQLADRAGCSAGHLSNIWYGTENPSGALANRLATAIEVPARDLILFPEPPASPIRKAREAAGLGLSDLAARAGCSPSALANIEAGRRNASKKLLARIAAALNCEPAELLDAA